jgi:hypothetical protein
MLVLPLMENRLRTPALWLLIERRGAQGRGAGRLRRRDHAYTDVSISGIRAGVSRGGAVSATAVSSRYDSCCPFEPADDDSGLLQRTRSQRPRLFEFRHIGVVMS